MIDDNTVELWIRLLSIIRSGQLTQINLKIMLNQEIEYQQVMDIIISLHIIKLNIQFPYLDDSDYLEGNQNYLYFSFTIKDNKPRAVGIVLFEDLPREQIQRVEFVDLQQNPINGYARITLANNEFNYPAFNCNLADVRVFFGKRIFWVQRYIITLKKRSSDIISIKRFCYLRMVLKQEIKVVLINFKQYSDLLQIPQIY